MPARIHKVCSISKTFVNIQDTHRILKLYQTPVTVYEHAFYIAKDALERYHQPMEKVLTNQVDTKVHVLVVHNVLL